MVRQRGALREARRAGRVLDVDRVIELQHAFASGELARSDAACARSSRAIQSVSSMSASTRSGQSARTSSSSARSRRRGTRGRAAGAHARLPQHVAQLGRLVRRVDVHEDGADARRRELRDDPFEAIRRPDADPVPLLARRASSARARTVVESQSSRYVAR